MNALITGASKGIGFEVAQALAKSNPENMVLISRSKDGLEKLREHIYKISPLTNVIPIASDLKLLIQNTEWLSNLSFRHLDILVNNAGTLVNSPFEETDLNTAKEIFEVNFHAPAQLVRLMLPWLKNSFRAHVVNIGSMGGFQGSSKYSGLSYYSASKAALAALTECLAVEFADTSIKTNCLALGAVQTEMLTKAFPGFHAPLDSKKMGEFIAQFAQQGHEVFNGQVLPVRLSNP